MVHRICHNVCPFCIIIQFKFHARITGEFSFKKEQTMLLIYNWWRWRDVRRMPGKLYLFSFYYYYFLLFGIFGGILIIKRKTIFQWKAKILHKNGCVNVFTIVITHCCNVLCWLLVCFGNVSSHWVLRTFCCWLQFDWENSRVRLQKTQHRARYFVFLYQFSCSHPTISCY